MNPMNKVLLRFAALAAMVLASGPTWAQDAPEGETPAAEGVDSGEGEAEAGQAEVSDATATKAERVLERDLALFWGNRREIKTVQKRLVEKDGRFELMPYASIIPNDEFIVYYPVGLRIGYHFSEAFSVEASYAYAIQQETKLATFLEAEGIGLKRADIQEKISMFYNANILWAPFYGKLSFLGYKLTHFESYIGLGVGLFNTTEFPAENPNGNDKNKISGNTIVGFRWFINDTLNLRTEYRQYFFQKFQGGVSIPAEISLGLGITL